MSSRQRAAETHSFQGCGIRRRLCQAVRKSEMGLSALDRKAAETAERRVLLRETQATGEQPSGGALSGWGAGQKRRTERFSAPEQDLSSSVASLRVKVDGLLSRADALPSCHIMRRGSSRESLVR